MKVDGARGADRTAGETIDTLGAFPFVIGVGIGLGFTMDSAEVAFDARVFIYFELDDVPSCHYSQKSTEGTEIAAPESLPVHI